MKKIIKLTLFSVPLLLLSAGKAMADNGIPVTPTTKTVTLYSYQSAPNGKSATLVLASAGQENKPIMTFVATYNPDQENCDIACTGSDCEKFVNAAENIPQNNTAAKDFYRYVYNKDCGYKEGQNLQWSGDSYYSFFKGQKITFQLSE